MPAYNTQHVQLSPTLILYTSIKWDGAFTQAGNLSRLLTPKKSQLCQKRSHWIILKWISLFPPSNPPMWNTWWVTKWQRADKRHMFLDQTTKGTLEAQRTHCLPWKPSENTASDKGKSIHTGTVSQACTLVQHIMCSAGHVNMAWTDKTLAVSRHVLASIAVGRKDQSSNFNTEPWIRQKWPRALTHGEDVQTKNCKWHMTHRTTYTYIYIYI